MRHAPAEILEAPSGSLALAPEPTHILPAPAEGPRAGALLSGVDPALRIVASFAFAFLVVLTDGMAGLVAAVALAIAALAAVGCGGARIWRAVAAVDGSMLLVIATLPFTTPGRPIFALAGFEASFEGLEHGLAIALKANAVTLMALALLGGAELPEIGHALRRLGAPAKLTHLLLMTVRYIEVLGREYRRLRAAMTVRGFRMGFNLHSWRSLGHLFGMLFARSFDRAARIGAAMRCRGFNGEFPRLEAPACASRNAAFLALSGGALALLSALRFV